ncbi:MAG: proline--tRNA ligase [Planctomycetota bacterium]
MQHLFGKRSPDAPSGSLLPSHQLLSRGGYVRQVGQGIFTLLPLGARIARKIEAILREEMDAIGCQELLMPVAVPDSLWQKSGRLDAVGSELVRFEDRTGQGHVLNMTHEEAVVDAAAANLDSYRQLPVAVYQIQTKFRDEPRSRGGLVRVREFTMKDAYSFHRTQESLEEFYAECHAAYERIFQRLGLSRVLSIKSDVGMMGGSLAHEFMFLSEFGEDHLIICPESGYKANREIASFDIDKTVVPSDVRELETVETPNAKTIDEVAAFLGMETTATARANALVADNERMILVFCRGDLNVSIPKLRAHLDARDVRPMQEEELTNLGLVAGFMGPMGLPDGVEIIIDQVIAKSNAMVVGANEPDKHVLGYNYSRDTPDANVGDIAEAAAGLPCPISGEPLTAQNGIEIGNIFQLGTKYSESMGFVYSEENGAKVHPIMGCYGIGVGRSLACIIEEHHDEHGPLWPMDMAPFQIALCCLQAKKPAVREVADKLYEELKALGADVLIDDRKLSPGIMFADADLVSAPVRVVVSPRNLDNGELELKFRTVSDSSDRHTSLKVEGAAQQLMELVESVRDADRRLIAERSPRDAFGVLS